MTIPWRRNSACPWASMLHVALLAQDRGAEELVAQRLGLGFVLAFLGGEIAQQLAEGSVTGAARGLCVEAPRVGLHDSGLFADLFQIERLQQPQRLALHETAHVLTADQQDALAEQLAVQLDQAMTVVNPSALKTG